MIVKALREGLGRVIVFGSFLTRPKRVARSSEEQQAVNERAAKMSLYQFYACPFCVLVRREMHRLNLPIVTRDAQNNTPYRQELLSEGGNIQVPCLRIDGGDKPVWMYESKEIIRFLKESFEPQTSSH